MPFAGFRSGSNAVVGNQGTTAFYWSSTSSSASSAYYFLASSTALEAQSAYYRADGNTIRCFKDSPVVPDNSWTTLYD